MKFGLLQERADEVFQFLFLPASMMYKNSELIKLHIDRRHRKHLLQKNNIKQQDRF